MFSSLGITEILIIAGVALVVLGPDKFPQVAKVCIRMFREVRSYWEDAKRDISKELRPVNKEMRELKHYKPEDYIDSLIGDDEDEEEVGEAGEDDASDVEDPYASPQHDYAEEQDDYEQYATPEGDLYGQSEDEPEAGESETTTADEDGDFGTDEPESTPTDEDDESDSTEADEGSDSGPEESEPTATDDEDDTLPERLDG